MADIINQGNSKLGVSVVSEKSMVLISNQAMAGDSDNDLEMLAEVLECLFAIRMAVTRM